MGENVGKGSNSSLLVVGSSVLIGPNSVGERVGFSVRVVGSGVASASVGDKVGKGSTGSMGFAVGRFVGILLGFLVGLGVDAAGPGVFGPQTSNTWQPATLPNSALQHSWTVLYNLESSSGKLLSFVHELGLRSVVLRCQNGPHSVGEYEGANVGCRMICR